MIHTNYCSLRQATRIVIIIIRLGLLLHVLTFEMLNVKVTSGNSDLLSSN